jgi:hypothetical protein
VIFRHRNFPTVFAFSSAAGHRRARFIILKHERLRVQLGRARRLPSARAEVRQINYAAPLRLKTLAR